MEKKEFKVGEVFTISRKAPAFKQGINASFDHLCIFNN